MRSRDILTNRVSLMGCCPLGSSNKGRFYCFVVEPRLHACLLFTCSHAQGQIELFLLCFSSKGGVEGDVAMSFWELSKGCEE